MRTYFLNLMLLSLLSLDALNANAAVRVGAGFSTLTSGRQIPALGLGINIGKDWCASGMLAGVRTEAYYSSGFMVNGLRTKDWGDFWFGRLEVGFGGGLYYGEKGIYTSVDQDGNLTNLAKDEDLTVGPAFRVAFKPLPHVFLSVEYLMGIGGSIISNAWEDVGMGAIGVEL